MKHLISIALIGFLLGCGATEATLEVAADAMNDELTVQDVGDKEDIADQGMDLQIPEEFEDTVELGPEAFDWEVSPTPGCTDLGCAAGPGFAPNPMEFGPYPVGIKKIVLTDTSRMKNGKPRTLVTEIWYPATDDAYSMPKFRYDPKQDAPDEVKEKIGDYEIGSYEVNAYYGAPVRHGDGRFPLILFSHGAFGIRYQSVSYTIPLASHGYVVMSPDHEGNTLYDLLLHGYDPSGLGDSALDRPLDLQFLLKKATEWDADPTSEFYKTIETDNVGITGHSFGGYTCFAATNLNMDGEPRPDPRVKVIVPQAPAGYLIPVVGIDPPNWHVPTLMEGGELDRTLDFDQAFMTPWKELGAPKWFLNIKRGGHFTFSDICRLNLLDVAQKLGFEDAANALSDGCGPMNWDWQEAAKAINLYSIAAFNRFLRRSEGSAKYMTAEAGAQFGNEIEWLEVLCDEGAWECSEDAYVLRRCIGGKWVEVGCMEEYGQLCEKGDCVDPWRYGSPKWSTCPDETHGTTESLAEKAAYYDELVTRLHIHPQLKWVLGGRLKPGVTEATATWQDIEKWYSGENDGLWSALYLASQAFRFAVTRSTEALANIKLLLEGEVDRMAITGVPGVFTRQLIPPGIQGLSCPTDEKEYVPDVEKDDNKWVKIVDGCHTIYDAVNGQWVKTSKCGLEKFNGYCWLDNVSQDEYAGHTFALGAILKLVDDPEVQAIVRNLIEQIAVELMENQLAFVDWDGRVTEHGKLWITSFADTPGFLATEALDMIRLGIEATDRDDLKDFYYNCLLQKSGPKVCIYRGTEDETPLNYLDYVDQFMLFFGLDGCKANYNNFSMIYCWIHNLIWFEKDPAIRERVQIAWKEQFMYPTDPNAQKRAGHKHHNAWFNFGYAAHKMLGPKSDGHAYLEVEDGICALKQFPASKAPTEKHGSAKYPFYCEGRLGDPETEFAIPVYDRCPRTFLWWGDPFSIEDTECNEDPRDLRQPADYLLAYWMGRYYGFIPEDL